MKTSDKSRIRLLAILSIILCGLVWLFHVDISRLLWPSTNTSPYKLSIEKNGDSAKAISMQEILHEEWDRVCLSVAPRSLSHYSHKLMPLDDRQRAEINRAQSAIIFYRHGRSIYISKFNSLHRFRWGSESAQLGIPGTESGGVRCLEKHDAYLTLVELPSESFITIDRR